MADKIKFPNDSPQFTEYTIRPTSNPWLDITLCLKRGVEPVSIIPTEKMCSGLDGFLHFTLPLTVAEEAAWWALEEEHAVPAQISVSLLRPGHLNNGPITGYGEQVRKGASVLTACGSAMQGGKQLCHVTVTFVRFEKKRR